jgi:cytochrome P450
MCAWPREFPRPRIRRRIPVPKEVRTLGLRSPFVWTSSRRLSNTIRFRYLLNFVRRGRLCASACRCLATSGWRRLTTRLTSYCEIITVSCRIRRRLAIAGCEPDHRRLRRLVEQAFQRQSVEALRPRLVALADDALDRLEQAAERQPAGVDLLEHFARPIPLAVICELLGLPSEDRPKFTRWAAGFSAARSTFGIVWGLRGLSSMMKYLQAEIARQSVHPRDGLLSSLIQAEEQGDRLSEEELVAMVFLLLAAGHETTLHQICGSVLILLEHPQHLRALGADWRAADPTVQELLRHLSFAQVSKPRYARGDLEFQERQIRRGEMVFACLASANSDPAQFANPERFDPHREPNRHVAFGSGIHYCLGAKLSSVELEIALERLFTRWPDLRLAIPREKLRYLPRFGTRALTALPVAWGS